MSNKEAILERIRKNKPVPTPLPEEIINLSSKPDGQLLNKFKKSLMQSGARVVELNGEDKLANYLKVFHQKIVDFENQKAWSKYSYDCPKSELEKIKTIIINGQFGVAENGAIWLDESNFPNRLTPFITQQLIIKLTKEKIVKDMHEAYNNLNLEGIGFGVFISRPSKTADIEQSLVYGAHGAKELIVILY